MAKIQHVKVFVFVIMLLFSPTVTARSSESSCDRRCIAEVKSIIASTSYSRGYPPSWIDKANTGLGDRVGIAIRKIYHGKRLFLEQNIREFLPVIRGAFSVPGNIRDSEDKKPENTVKLLKDIGEATKNRGLKQAVSETINFVLKQSQHQESRTVTSQTMRRF